MQRGAFDGTYGQATRRSGTRLYVLLGLLAVLAATGVTIGLVERGALAAIPEPLPTAATLEPPPAGGAETAALAEARSLTDAFALDDAEAILVGVVRRDRTNALAHAYLARVAYRRGQMTDGSCRPEAVAAAERELAEAEALQPGLVDAIVVRAYLRLFANDFQGAWTLGNEAKRPDWRAPRVAMLMAQIASRAGDLNEAEKAATFIIRNVREGWVVDRAYDILGDVYAARKDYVRLTRLHQSPGWRQGKDGWGKPR